VGTPWRQTRDMNKINEMTFTNRSGLIFVGPGIYILLNGIVLEVNLLIIALLQEMYPPMF
jgi:hypothetical protein